MKLRFVVVTHCNADCYFCLNEYIGSKSSAYSMLPEHYGMIMKIASTLGSDVCTITGGEPTLRSDLYEIVTAIRPFSKNITMVSNGYKLHKHVAAIKLLDELHVSYHSMNDKEWERITKVPDGATKVRDNLVRIRDAAPDLRIKLNVVAEAQNSSIEEVLKYINLAGDLRAEVTVFKESCSLLMQELGVDIANPETADTWDMEKFGGVLIKQNDRRKTYCINNAIINVQKTSSESPSWSSCWISPLGYGFADPRQRSKLVDFSEHFNTNDHNNIELGLLSLFLEAYIMRCIELDNDRKEQLTDIYNQILFYREHNLNTAEPITVKSLPLWQK